MNWAWRAPAPVLIHAAVAANQKTPALYTMKRKSGEKSSIIQNVCKAQ